VEIPSSIQSLLPKPWQELSDSEKRFTAALIAYATGAGDSFLSGILVGLAGGAALNSAIGTGINWATVAITEVGSIPPRWREEFKLE
jgi:sugar/nucleoside kinase (ribokinase family)